MRKILRWALFRMFHAKKSDLYFFAFFAWLGGGLLVVPAVSRILDGRIWREWGIMSRLTLGGVFQAFALLLVTILVAVALMTRAPLGKVSWIGYLARRFSKKEKPDLGGGTNFALVPLTIPFLGFPFLASFVLCIPGFAKVEEEMIRYGDYGLAEGALYSLLFGLSHWAMGVPFGVALAISFPGFFFMLQSRIGGTDLSAAYHSMYNFLILAVLFITMLVRDIAAFKRLRKEVRSWGPDKEILVLLGKFHAEVER